MLSEIIVSVLLLVGGAFALLGSFGLARLPDFFMRLHGPTKATTLGVGAIIVASLLHVGASENEAGLRELAVTLFLLITAPVTAHLLSKAALAEQRRMANNK
ncbi:MAG: Na+/H+ antiporter subunit G [Caulobacteraceae bacterium]